MEEARHGLSRERNETDQLAVAIARQRSRIEEFLAAQQKRLDAAGAALTREIEAAGKRLSQGRLDADRRREELQQQAGELDRQTEILARFKEELYARQAEREAAIARSFAQQAALAEQIQRQQDGLDERLTALDARRKEIAEAENALAEREQGLAATGQGEETQRDLVSQRQNRLEEELARLAAEREELAARRAHTEGQRRRIAEELRAQRAAQVRKIERYRAEVEQEETERLSQMRRELAGTADREAQLRESLAAETEQRSRLEQELAAAVDEREALAGRIAEAEARRAEAEERAAGAAEASEVNRDAEDYQRRYEMALDDLRELREQNRQLEEKVAHAAAAPRPPVAAGRLDWETEKGRILAALELQAESDDVEAAQQRLRIEQVIKTTDLAVASKEDEIAELKRVLAEQSTSLASVAVGAAAVGAVLDKDAVIQEERENIRRLKNEWQEKFRAAEVALSIERATLARQKLELDERLRAVGVSEKAASGEHAAPTPKPDRARWLSHLGLRNTEKDKEDN